MDFFHRISHKRQPARLVDGVNELLLLGRRLSSRPFHLDCQEPACLRNATDNVGNAASVRGDVGAVGLPYAGVLVLVAGDAAKAEVVENLLLDVLFEDGS